MSLVDVYDMMVVVAEDIPGRSLSFSPNDKQSSIGISKVSEQLPRGAPETESSSGFQYCGVNF